MAFRRVVALGVLFEEIRFFALAHALLDGVIEKEPAVFPTRPGTKLFGQKLRLQRDAVVAAKVLIIFYSLLYFTF